MSSIISALWELYAEETGEALKYVEKVCMYVQYMYMYHVFLYVCICIILCMLSQFFIGVQSNFLRKIESYIVFD